MAFQVRPMQNWGWILFSGILALVLSAIIWMDWPGDALWVIGLLLGVNLLFSGLGTVMFALGTKGISTGCCCSGGSREATPST